jgi:hypothetical protein
VTASKEIRPVAIRFKEVWPEAIRHFHAIIAVAEIVWYARPDGMTMGVESVSVSLIGPLRKVHQIALCRAAEDGEHVEDRFFDGSREVADEIAKFLYPAGIARLMSAVIEADGREHLPLVGEECSHPRWVTVCAL